MQSKTWIEKASSDIGDKKWLSYEVEKAPFNPRIFDYSFQLDQTVEKTDFRSNTPVGFMLRKSVKIPRHTSVTHARYNTTKHDTTPHHNIGDTGLSLLLAARLRDTSLYTPARSTCQHPMAAVRGIDYFLPTAALAVALAALEEVQRHDGLEDEREENAPCVKLTRCSRKKRDNSMYVRLGAENLSDPKSIGRSSSELTSAYPTLFLGASQASHSITPNASGKNTKTVYSIRRTTRRVAIHNPVGK